MAAVTSRENVPFCFIKPNAIEFFRKNKTTNLGFFIELDY